MTNIEIRQQAASLPALIDGAAARLTAARTSARGLSPRFWRG
jgi:hypothetical protein